MADNAGNTNLDSNLLAWSAARAARWPHLFSMLVDHYLELNNMSEEELRALLSCDSDTLNHLRLCGRPDPDSPEFAIDIERVAGKFGLDAGTLASIVREVDAIEAFTRAARIPTPGTGRSILPFSSTPGMLQAARDHDEGSGVRDRGSGMSGQGPGNESDDGDKHGKSSSEGGNEPGTDP